MAPRAPVPMPSPAAATLRARHGASLIEAGVLAAILLIALGGAWGVLAGARRERCAVSTRAILAKVDTALRQYRSDVGLYPWQARYPLGSALGDARPDWSNRLGYSLGQDMTMSARTQLRDDMEAAAAACARDPDLDAAAVAAPWAEATSATEIAARTPAEAVPDAAILRALGLRLLEDRARLLVLGGDRDVSLATLAPRAAGAAGARGTAALLPVGSAERAGAGYAANYLQDSLSRSLLRDDAILDGWGHPLIYINQVVPIAIGTGPADAAPALAAIGGARAGGRIRLDHACPADPYGGLPDPARLRHSDITTYAAPGYEREFELWSAGPDGRFDAMRDGADNRDNIAADAYDAALTP